jgi:hypothetical protein
MRSIKTTTGVRISLVGQMTESERIDYFAESLFHNTVRYENERLAAYMKKLTEKGGKTRK